MRKLVFFLILLGLCLFAALPGLCQTVTLDTIYATVTIPDTYTLLTPQNMENNLDFLNSRQTTLDVMLQTFEAEGILLQAWLPDGSACLEITALNDVDAQTYFDIDQQSSAVRAKYRAEHRDGASFEALGISYDSAEWKNTTAYGRFLMLKYVQRIDGKVDHRGFARRTIRNGYTITIDYKVYDRALKAKDNTALNDVMNTWHFIKVLPLSAAGDTPSAAAATTVGSSALTLEVTAQPPEQTDSASFTVKGNCTSGAEVVGSISSASGDSFQVKDTSTKSGKFSLQVKLPKQGAYLMTLSMTVNGQLTESDQPFSITYDKALLPVNFDTEFPSTLDSDKLVISGTTTSGAEVQLTVNGKNNIDRAGSGGRFSFNIDTSQEGSYSITLVFTKKGMNEKRFTFTATREWTQEQREAKIKKEAIKPAYSVLTDKISGYTGRIMGYNAYVMSYDKSSAGWVVYMAMRKLDSGYKDIIVVSTTQEPTFTVGTQAKMYGRCTGMYLVQSDTGSQEYPSFELLFWDD